MTLLELLVKLHVFVRGSKIVNLDNDNILRAAEIRVNRTDACETKQIKAGFF